MNARLKDIYSRERLWGADVIELQQSSFARLPPSWAILKASDTIGTTGNTTASKLAESTRRT